MEVVTRFSFPAGIGASIRSITPMREPSEYHGAERRRHERRPLRLEAELDANGTERATCTVLDFCEGGLFLSVAGVDDGFLVLGARQVVEGAALWVSFQVQLGATTRAFRVPVMVARTSAMGMGVRFDPPQPDALTALNALAMVAQAPPGTMSPQAAEIFDGLHEHASQWLRQTLKTLFKAAVDDMFVQARDATSNEVQSECMDAMKDVERVADKVSNDCRSAVLGLLERLGPKRTGDSENADEAELGIDTSSLTLVDTGSFDDWVTAKNVMNRAEPKLRDAIFELGRRLGALFQREFDEFSNPLGIQQLGMQFNESMQNLGLPSRARKAIYKGFEDVFVASVAELYQLLNGYLADEGVNPSMERAKRVSQPRRKNPPATAERSDDTATGPIPHAHAEDATLNQVMPASTGHDDWAAYHQGLPAEGHAARAGELAPHVANQAAQAPQLPYVPMPPPVAYSGGWMAPASAPPPPALPVAQAFTAAQHLMGMRAAMSRGQAAQPRQASPLSHEPPTAHLTQALNRIGRSAEFNQASDGQPMRLGERLMSSLTRDGVDLSPPQRDMMNLLSTLVEAVLGDPLIREPIKPRIKRLAVPMLKTALEDASFFSDEAHPARQVVNRLGMIDLPATRAEGESGDSLASNVDPLLDAIVNTEGSPLGSFQSAIPALDELLLRQSSGFEQRVTQLLSSAEHDQALHAAEVAPLVATDTNVTAWIERAGRLSPGDVVAFGAKGRRPDPRTLAWVSDDRSLFVFTDRDGSRGMSLGRVELAERMAKGNIALLDTPDLPVMDRGLFQVLNDVHREVAEESRKDSVTGLHGLEHFKGEVDHAMAQAHKVGSKHALLALDLDGFARVNDKGTRKAGDSLLRKIARLLQGQIGKDGAITRVRADEFLVLLTDHGFMDAKRFAERQCRAIANARVAFKEEQFPISISIGLVPVTRASESCESVIEHAKAALHSAKRRGKNQVRVFDPDEDVVVVEPAEAPSAPEADASAPTSVTHVAPEAAANAQVVGAPHGDPAVERITDKMDNGELVLRRQLVQPLQDDDGKPHYEILLAQSAPDPGQTQALPANMIPDAERDNLMPTVDRWVIRTALAWMQKSRREVLKSGGYAINLSGSSLSDPKLLEFVVGMLTETAIPPAKVIFEVTESAAIDRLSNAVEFIRTLREYGCRFSIDDFGAGHATFTYLRTLPVDFVKIDGLFVRELATNSNDLAMVTSIHEISHMLGKKTIAEHVENDEALAALKSMGVDYGQGYAIARPEVLP